MSTETTSAAVPAAPAPAVPAGPVPGSATSAGTTAGTGSRDRQGLPLWPLFIISAGAVAVVWSGWVGLGAMCGYGSVHPLPGLPWGLAHFRLNTAITLPLGMEAYGTYALTAWLGRYEIGERARVFACRSAIGAFGLGMLAQVAYHLLAAAHRARAPWPVVVFVSCLPVVTLGFGAALAHMSRHGSQATPEPVPAMVPDAVPAVPAPPAIPPVPAITGTAPVATPAARREPRPRPAAKPAPQPAARPALADTADLLARARKINATFRAEHGRDISAETLRTRMGIKKQTACGLLREIKGMPAPTQALEAAE